MCVVEDAERASSPCYRKFSGNISKTPREPRKPRRICEASPNPVSSPQESAEEDIDLCEFLQALPRKQHGRVWNAVLQLAHGIVGRLEKSEGELHDDPSVDKVRLLSTCWERCIEMYGACRESVKMWTC